jgi:thiamine-monophosphate kinase
MTKIKDIGEQGLLKIVQQFCPSEVVGDDAALVKVEADQSLVVTTDVLVDGVHFSDRTMTAADVGWRAIATNLSDIAAMGATPLGVTIGLSLPPELEVSWVENLYQGLFSCVQNYHTVILGGDLTRSPVITLAITALGQVKPKRVISRYDAQVGDAIVVTGLHGSSRAGLELLLNPDFLPHIDITSKNRLIQAHQRPQPRLDCVELLQNLTHQPTHIGGMDSSDGLADALIQICRCSQVGAEINSQQIPIDRELTQLISQPQALELALYGGEDFELVLTLEPDLACELITKLGGNAAIIGIITPNSTVKITDLDLELTLEKGFQHF